MSGLPPRQSSNSISSSSRPRASNDDDLTWLDFLRTAGAERSSNTSTSQERKRRHAGSSPERRGYPYPSYNPALVGRRPSGMSAVQAGSSRDNAIDLTSSPGGGPVVPRRVSGGSLGAMGVGVRGFAVGGGVRGNGAATGPGDRRDSDFVLPRWQADADVNKCPVCQTEFHFFYRKHHCRKCGRVVCAACSPHRITIPKQYIVQPPTASEGGGETSVSPTTGNLFARNLGGGEVVRVCNPCVPDPWTPDAASDATTRPRGDEAGRRESAGEAHNRPDRYRHVPLPPPPNSDSSRARAYTHQPTAGHFSRSVPHHSNTSGFVLRDPYNRPPPIPPSSSRTTNHLYTQSSSASNAPLPPIPARPPMSSAPSAAPQPRPRRETREEDECPVCGTELPPGEQVRESHIQECITTRFGSAPSNSAPMPPPPITDHHGASRPRATSYRPRGMALYRATEKDCMNEEGGAQECVICFGEFQPGDEMGRMECLCKFHRGCIRLWWETKGAGSCPTHQLHE
ncbi:hypothetical protein LTR37_006413 [Vermiconidia calcicola]|uniref:Uncharacterized protein n=1 Tax=Vermiconidia calcicola TaxID=1690605 RepID=A0ACC3NGT3_9PEZI|nr:hypothetical protein LTR37_006413 [Vermiconidia calcicola]